MIAVMPPRGPHRAAYLRGLRHQRAQRKVAVAAVMANMDSLNGYVSVINAARMTQVSNLAQSVQVGAEQEAAQRKQLGDQLRKQIKLNDLFEKLFAWRRGSGSYATVGDMMAFYKQARIEFGFTAEETHDIEKAVENRYFAELEIERRRLVSQLIPPISEPPGFWRRLCWLMLGPD